MFANGLLGSVRREVESNESDTLFFKRQSGCTEWLRRTGECKSAAYRAFDVPARPAE